MQPACSTCNSSSLFFISGIISIEFVGTIKFFFRDLFPRTNDTGMQITIAIARIIARDINPDCNCESLNPIIGTLEVPGEDIESIVVVGGNIVVAAAVVVVVP